MSDREVLCLPLRSLLRHLTVSEKQKSTMKEKSIYDKAITRSARFLTAVRLSAQKHSVGLTEDCVVLASGFTVSQCSDERCKLDR